MVRLQPVFFMLMYIKIDVFSALTLLDKVKALKTSIDS